MKKITMYFHCAGVVSEQRMDILEDTRFTIVLDGGQDCPYIFLKQSGKCLNESSELGCYKTIRPIKPKKK